MVNRLLLRLTFWLMRRLQPPSQKLAIPRYTPREQKEIIRNLVDHPGWLYLMADLESHKAMFETQRAAAVYRIPLNTNSEELTRQLIRLDEAINWIGWLQWRIKMANAMPAVQPREDAALVS